MARWDNNRLSDWVIAEQGQHHCACGCGGTIQIQPDFRRHGIPHYIHGHNSRGKSNPSFKNVENWVKKNQDRVLCACGCDLPVKIQSHHFYAGIPEYVHGHNAKGVGNPNWKDGGSEKYNRRRNSAGMRKWKHQIRDRDGRICQMPGCPNPENPNIHAHHIIGYTKDENLKFELWNGITLCAPCHYAVKGKEENFEEFFFALLEKRGIHGSAE